MNTTNPIQMETIKWYATHRNLPEHLVRMAVMNGDIVAIRAGRKILVNVSKADEWLNTNRLTPTDKTAEAPKMTAEKTADNPRGFAPIEI